jgi:selenocysteine lyase/cysteine desulfurase
MKKLLISLFAISLVATSCKTVYSTTEIEAKKSFVLGDNEHESFEVSLKNISKEDLEISQMPNGGAKQLLQTLNPNESTTIKIDKNTALYIKNKTDNKASVELNLKSNTHLSMGYKN